MEPVESVDEFICDDCDQNVLTLKCPDEFIDAKDEDVVVWVDPLDGTREFTKGD